MKPYGTQTLSIQHILIKPIFYVESLLVTQTGNTKFHKICYELSILLWNICVTKKLTECILTLLW